MKLSLPLILILSIMVVVVSYYTTSRAVLAEHGMPQEFTSADWIRALPHTPGAITMPNIPEALELQNYGGFRLFGRLPAFEAKPGLSLYYLYGTDVYEGPRNHRRLVREGLGPEGVGPHRPGGMTGRLPEGFEFTVLYRRDKEKGGVSGYARLGFVDKDSIGTGRTTGAEAFHLDLAPNELSGGGVYRPAIVFDKKIVVGELVADKISPDGRPDEEHATTVQWYFILHVAPHE